MASGPITSWEIDGETVETVSDFILGGTPKSLQMVIAVMKLKDPYSFELYPGGKASASNVGGPGSIPGWGRSPGEGLGYPFQYSSWRIPMDRGAGWATVHGDAKSRTGLSD